jgi:hypothetical protein
MRRRGLLMPKLDEKSPSNFGKAWDELRLGPDREDDSE